MSFDHQRSEHTTERLFAISLSLRKGGNGWVQRLIRNSRRCRFGQVHEKRW